MQEWLLWGLKVAFKLKVNVGEHFMNMITVIRLLTKSNERRFGSVVNASQQVMVVHNLSISKNHGKYRNHGSRAPYPQSNHFSSRLVQMVGCTTEGGRTAARLVGCDDKDKQSTGLSRHVASVTCQQAETSIERDLLVE